MFTFYDMKPEWLPANGNPQYFHKVTLITIGIQSDSDILDKEIDDLWQIDNLTNWPAQAFYIYRDNELPSDMEYEIQRYNNAVIEVRDNEICWYRGEL